MLRNIRPRFHVYLTSRISFFRCSCVHARSTRRLWFFLLHDDYSRSRYALLFKNVLSCHVSTSVVSTDHVKTDMSGHAETQARLSHVKSTALAHQIRVSLRWRRLPPKNASNDGTADARPSISQIKANTGVCVIKVVQTSTTSLDICSFTHSIDIIKHAICQRCSRQQQRQVWVCGMHLRL